MFIFGSLDSGMVTRGSDTADSSNVEDDIYKKFQARKNYINNADIHESDVEVNLSQHNSNQACERS